MGIQNVGISGQTVSDPGDFQPSPTTPAEAALLARAKIDLRTWCDSKGYASELDGQSQLSQWRSRALIGALQPQFNSPSPANYIYGAPEPASPNYFELRPGRDLSDNTIVGLNFKIMNGNSYMRVPPTGNVTFVAFVRIPASPAPQDILFGTAGTTGAMALDVISTLGQRWYSNHTTNTFINSPTASLTNAYTLQVYKADRANNLGSIINNEIVVRSPVAFTLPDYAANPLINLGYIMEGASPVSNTGFGVIGFLIINSIDDVTLTLYKAVLRERGLYT